MIRLSLGVGMLVCLGVIGVLSLPSPAQTPRAASVSPRPVEMLQLRQKIQEAHPPIPYTGILRFPDGTRVPFEILLVARFLHALDSDLEPAFFLSAPGPPYIPFLEDLALTPL